MSRRLFAATLGLGSCYLFYRHSRIHSITSLRPREFQSLTTKESVQRLYERKLDRPLPPSETSNDKRIHPSKRLAEFLKSYFNTGLYKLELYLSEAKEDIASLDFENLETGQRIGNLCVESFPSSNEIIFIYKYPGLDFGLFKTKDFDFRLYFATPSERNVLCGFVDYSDDWTQVLGSKIFITLTLETAARNLDSEWIIRKDLSVPK